MSNARETNSFIVTAPSLQCMCDPNRMIKRIDSEVDEWASSRSGKEFNLCFFFIYLRSQNGKRILLQGSARASISVKRTHALIDVGDGDSSGDGSTDDNNLRFGFRFSIIIWMASLWCRNLSKNRNGKKNMKRPETKETKRKKKREEKNKKYTHL